jgi:ribonuclease HII
MLNDSKKLSPTLRQRLLPLIQASATCSVGQACLEEIEQLNIYHASILASFRALKSLTQQLNIREHQLFVLLDGKGTLPDWPKSQQQPIIKGDTLSASIAAASIVAKEARDDYIREISQHHPQYGWHQNMGYGTVKHKLAIQQHGITPYHRQSFKL